MNKTLKYYRSKRDRLQLRYGNRLYNQRGRKKKEFVLRNFFLTFREMNPASSFQRVMVYLNVTCAAKDVNLEV